MFPLARLQSLAALLFAAGFWTSAPAAEFSDPFRGALQADWRWIREQPGAWRTTDQGLEIRVLPGNMWGGANNARNVLVRAAPDPAQQVVQVSVRLSNQPTEQFEQVDLVWYYDDSHMVKLGQELVDGKLSIVMGREEKDQTRTIAIVPLATTTVEVRFHVQAAKIRGEFRPAGEDQWQLAGECDLPVKGAPQISLQCYQGPGAVEHWARLNDFLLRSGSTPPPP